MAPPLEGIKDATMITESTVTGPVPLAPGSGRPRSAGVTESIYATAARVDRVGFVMPRIGLVVELGIEGLMRLQFASLPASRGSTEPEEFARARQKSQSARYRIVSFRELSP
jgi:hypothetical protein